jgi:hypothetical protein
VPRLHYGDASLGVRAPAAAIRDPDLAIDHSMDSDTPACRRSFVGRRVLTAPISPCKRSPGGGALARLAET